MDEQGGAETGTELFAGTAGSTDGKTAVVNTEAGERNLSGVRQIGNDFRRKDVRKADSGETVKDL